MYIPLFMCETSAENMIAQDIIKINYFEDGITDRITKNPTESNQ